jgi:hypothetical protein
VADERIRADSGDRGLRDLAPDERHRAGSREGQRHRRAEVADTVGAELHQPEVAEPQLPLEQPHGHAAHPAEDEDDRQQREVRRPGRQPDDLVEQRADEQQQRRQEHTQPGRHGERGGDVDPLQPPGLHDRRTDAPLRQHDREAGDHRGRRRGAELPDGEHPRQHHDGYELEECLSERSDERP